MDTRETTSHLIGLGLLGLAVVLAFWALRPAREENPAFSQPFNQAELDRYLADYPQVAAGAICFGPTGKADNSGPGPNLHPTPRLGALLERLGWNKDRFIYIHRRIAACRLVLDDINIDCLVQSLQKEQRAILASSELSADEKEQLVREIEKVLIRAERTRPRWQPCPEEIELVKLNRWKIEERYELVFLNL
ncbi:MAG: hypothetical protein AB1641_21190 [Thermodesulfobacteriota bacterium]